MGGILLVNTLKKRTIYSENVIGKYVAVEEWKQINKKQGCWVEVERKYSGEMMFGFPKQVFHHKDLKKVK